MAYNPSLHTTTNKALGVAQANPTDARSYFYDGATFTYRAYASTAEVLSYLTPNTIRAGNFSIYVSNAGVIQEWWFKDGTADANLVQKTSLQGQPAGGDLSGTYPNPTVAKFNGQLPAYYLARANHTGTQAATTIVTDTNNRFVTDAQITQWNNAASGGVSTSNPNTWTAVQTIQVNGVGLGSAEGFAIVNNTAATASVNQNSPRLRFKGSYITGVTSRTLEFIEEARTLAQGTAGGLLRWSSSLDGAAYVTAATLSDGGNFAATGMITGSNLTEPSATSLRIGSDATSNNTTNMVVVGRAVAGGANNSAVFGYNCKMATANLRNIYFGININSAAGSYNSSCYFGMDITPAAGNQIGIGQKITSNSVGQICLLPTSGGGTVSVTGVGAILIGDLIAVSSGNIQGGIAIGKSVNILDNQTDCVAIGNSAKAYLDPTYGSGGSGQVAIGETSFAGSWRAIAIGGHAQALAVSSSAFGYGCYAIQSHANAWGRGAYNDKANSILLYIAGSATGGSYYFGGVASAWNNPAMPSGETVDTSTSQNAGTYISRLYGRSGRDANATPSLTDIRGGHLRIIGGQSTGLAAGGDIDHAVTLPGGTSNNTENAETVIMKHFGATGETQFQKGGTYTSIPGAIVSINSTVSGFLLPRMTTTQRDAIATKPEGLMIYNTTTHKVETWNATSWI